MDGFGLPGKFFVLAGGPKRDLGFGHIRIDKMPSAVARAIVGSVPLRRHPPYVRVDICGEGVGAPLPANTEEH